MKENGNDFRITRNISFSDVCSGRLSPIDVYYAQVREWLLNPGTILSEPFNSDHGMALLSIELLFFEPHAQYLKGQQSSQKSRIFFQEAFDRFLDYLEAEQLILEHERPDPSSLYKWLRCGLFHSSTVSNEILVDAAFLSKHSISKNRIVGGWLINPWLLLNQIDRYMQRYVREVKNNPESELSKNFLKTFDRLVGGAIRQHVDDTYSAIS